ncbi:ATPase [Vibrio crassostreae]|nr:ATPase [Vibrio crassostreae]CAK3497713.1 ATPase [Vibrio crassostreae]CAK3520136.1 ATPase [Vibrio crassostreae]CAK3525945.1 ATPase [Vibrio crassostreae]CAK3556174.1 ATPase [Vibrio crassostreae]
MSFWVKVIIVCVPLSANVVLANQCSSESWQLLLDRQLSFEGRYNQYTKEFNQVLSTYKSQTLLSKHFTKKQIIELWAKYEQRFNVQLNSHMNTAYDVSEVLLKQAYVVSTELDGAESLTHSWQAVAKHCARAKLPRQTESAQVHVQSSQSLSRDLHTLSEKFRQLSSIYRREATMIDEARHTNQPISDVSN